MNLIESQCILNSNTAMVVKIVHFLIVLFIFHTVTSTDTSQIKNLEENLETIENGLDVYGNATILSIVENLEMEGAKMDIRNYKNLLSIQLYNDLIEIIQLRGNTTRQISKMIYDTETLLNSIKKSLAKENNPETLDDLFLSMENEGLIKQLEKSINQLKTLKSKLYAINKDHTKSLKYNGVSKALQQFSHDDSTEVPVQVSWNEDVNDEEPLVKLDIDLECDELEKLRRFSLMVQDELKEMPRSNNGIPEDNMHSESNSRNPLPESATVPLWLLHERDIEEIRLKYITWTSIFQQHDKEELNIMKKGIRKRGYSIPFFCKILAEYYNLTTKLLECTSQDDSECEKMLVAIMQHQHYQDIVQIMTSIGQLDI
ncbi:uncharacterized protein LOC135835199 isoform X1 [Planococcus citri]|uniref:uncharacterized protein LOC135835199 isoform X1 n=1 Tax=Planococcus citri TaxID=170843 RepID=UPI0031F79E82